MKHFIKKSWILGISLVFAFLGIGFINMTNGVTIETDPTIFLNLLHKTRLHTLFLWNGSEASSAKMEVYPGGSKLSVLRGLIIDSGTGFEEGNSGVVGYAGGLRLKNEVTGINAGVLGGIGNDVQGDNAGIAGGQYSTGQGNNIVIGGGRKNIANGALSTIGGGVENQSISGVVVGGYKNQAKQDGVVLGGINNKAGKNSLALGESSGSKSYERDLSFTWNAGKIGKNDDNVAVINANGGVLVGTYTPIENVALVVKGAVKVGKHSHESYGGEVALSGGCLYGYIQDGFEGNAFGNASLSNSGVCGEFNPCVFGESLLMNGDTVTGYANYFSTGTCKGERISCNNGTLSKDGYFPYCYELGSGAVYGSGIYCSSYKVIYHCGDGSTGGPYEQIFTKEGGKLRSDGCTKSNATLIGWATESNATTPKWSLGGKMGRTMDCDDKHLYAVYQYSEVNYECQGSKPGGAIENTSVKPDNNTTFWRCDASSSDVCTYTCPAGQECDGSNGCKSTENFDEPEDDYAEFLPGTTFNTELKRLVGYDSSKIKYVKWWNGGSSNLGAGKIKVSTTRGKDIYAWYDNGTVYYYTDADTIYLNQDSSSMFKDFTDMMSLEMHTWDTSNVTNMGQMFDDCYSLTSLNLSSWDTSKVTNMEAMFDSCWSLTQLDLSKFDTRNVTNMGDMFNNCTGLQNVNISSFNTSRVKTMAGMFKDCNSLTSLTFGSKWDTSSVISMQSMFDHCGSLTSLDLSNFDTIMVENMLAMFWRCDNLTSLTFGSKWNTSGVKTMSSMFASCEKLTSLDVSNWVTSKVEDMSLMFAGCSSLTNLDVSSWDTSRVKDMQLMFHNMGLLTSLDLSNFDTREVLNMNRMFSASNKLTTIYASDKFKIDQVTASEEMFAVNLNLKGGNGTTYTDAHTNKEYARIDGKNGLPGYFTQK